MKGIIVVDMPKNCHQCPLYSEEYDCCNMEKQDDPDWCPIKQIPEKRNESREIKNNEELLQLAIDFGYNSCIDEILKGE